MARLQTLTRNELFAIFKNEKIVRAFESLIDELNNAPDTLNALVDEVEVISTLTDGLVLGSFQRPAASGVPPGELVRSAVMESSVFLPRNTPAPPADPLQSVLLNRCFGSR